MGVIAVMAQSGIMLLFVVQQTVFPEGKTCVRSPVTVSQAPNTKLRCSTANPLSASKEYCCEQNQALMRNAPLSQTNGPSNSWQFSCCLGRASELAAC